MMVLAVGIEHPFMATGADQAHQCRRRRCAAGLHHHRIDHRIVRTRRDRLARNRVSHRGQIAGQDHSPRRLIGRGAEPAGDADGPMSYLPRARRFASSHARSEPTPRTKAAAAASSSVMRTAFLMLRGAPLAPCAKRGLPQLKGGVLAKPRGPKPSLHITPIAKYRNAARVRRRVFRIPDQNVAARTGYTWITRDRPAPSINLCI